MANVTTCSECGHAFEAGSEEQANEPDRLCPKCERLRNGESD
jgi:predicted Zn-ribbon and HTH transcriptional regulator